MRTWTEWVSLGQLPDSPCFSFLVLSAFQSRTWTLSQIAFKCPGPWHKTQAHRSGKFRDSRPNMTPENKHDFLAKRTCKICEPSFCLEVLEVLLGSSCWWRYFGVFEDHLEDPRNMFYRVHHIRNQKGGSWRYFWLWAICIVTDNHLEHFFENFFKKFSRLRTFSFLSVPQLRKQHLEHSPQHKPLSVMLDLVWGWGGRAIIYIGYIGKYPHVLSVAFRRCGNIYIHVAFKNATRAHHVSRR